MAPVVAFGLEWINVSSPPPSPPTSPFNPTLAPNLNLTPTLNRSAPRHRDAADGFSTTTGCEKHSRSAACPSDAQRASCHRSTPRWCRSSTDRQGCVAPTTWRSRCRPWVQVMRSHARRACCTSTADDLRDISGSLPWYSDGSQVR